MENNQSNRLEHLDNVQCKDTEIKGINPHFDHTKFDGIKMNPEHNAIPTPIDQGNNITPGLILDHVNELGNPFPIEIFPEPFRKYVTECHNCLGFPIDFTAIAVLTAVSTAIGKSAKFKVKNLWSEYCSIYAGIIGNSGTAKSHPIDNAVKPFIEFDRNSIKWYNIKQEEFKATLELSKKEKTNSDHVEKPVLKKFVLNNFTPEVLHQRLADNERSCIIVSDELATFLEGMNNYSKGDQSGLYLSFWSNKSTSVDRINAERFIWLEDPFLNILGSLQPRVLSKVFPAGKVDNGFLQRFLFAYPDNVYKQPINDNQIPAHIIDAYSIWIKEYIKKNPINIDFETGESIPKLYYWEHTAKLFFYEWQKLNTEKVNQNSDTIKGEILSKFDIHFVRLALILQIMDNYESEYITHKAVMASSKLCSYFIKNAFKVLDILENTNPVTLLSLDKQNFYNALPEDFTTSNAILIGMQFSFNDKAVQRFLKDTKIFIRQSHGNYSKKF